MSLARLWALLARGTRHMPCRPQHPQRIPRVARDVGTSAYDLFGVPADWRLDDGWTGGPRLDHLLRAWIRACERDNMLTPAENQAALSERLDRPC